jgi:hypothetical protein
MPGHRDIPDEIVKRAQLYDHDHFREDRRREGWSGSWGRVPADQVRRLIWGACGELLVTAESLHAEIREGLETAERGETVDLGSFAEYADE